MANFGCPLLGVHLLYELQTARAHGMEHAEHFGANGYSVHDLEVYKIISQVVPVYPHSNVQTARQLPVAN